MPGVSVGIGIDGKIALSQGYGYRDVARRFPAGANTVYQIGSLSKQFTAAAILILASQRKLDLDRRVSAYDPHAPHAAEITVRQLLNQTSGLREVIDTPLYQDYAIFTSSLAVTLEYLRSFPLEFEPGSRWQYSNSNYLLLARLVSIVSHTPYSDYIRRVIIRPLKLNATSLIVETKTATKDTATGYLGNGGGYGDPLERISLNWLVGAGSMSSSVVDLVHWDQALLGNRTIFASAFKSMAIQGRLRDGKSTGYGLGFYVDRLDGVCRAYHTGGLPGFASANVMIPRHRVDVVVLANSLKFDPLVAATVIARIVNAEVLLEDVRKSPREENDHGCNAKASHFRG